VVNNRSTTDAKGKTTVSPLTKDELDKLTALVQESIGYSKERGDSVKVINAPFKAELAPKPEELPLWKQPWLLDLLRAGAVPAALGLTAMFVVFGLIRPALRAMQPPPPVKGGQLDVVADEDPAPVPQLQAPQSADRLANARTLAKENPAAVAHIVRSWVSGETD
ncbi:MAG TPA: flagellar M-ring protein FliF C-terminal domain-containing protein, partial [Burkholderiaceae bacterium]|nr:flagellar M-ring protein FliF C-terminal domain-containing protein [Burkholderiaceae bacterium]